MSKHVTYHLNFRSPLHLGRRGVGLEETGISIPADTLFSAICQTWRTFYGEESLTDFLDQYETDEPFLLTSAFPFASDIRFFPKPLIDLNVNADDDRKELKKVRYLSEKRFRQIVDGEPIAFDAADLINDGQLWIHGNERAQFQDNPTVWKTDKRPRVTLDRQSSASEIWHLKVVKFEKGCGLWFNAKFEAEEAQTQIETLLRVLGDTGVGGERSAGYGIFDLHSESAEPESEPETNRFVTLSPICPRDAEQLNALIQDSSQGDIGYALAERSGWIGSSEGNGLRRQQVWMFTEGSVLNGHSAQVGRLVDLKPEACPHPVWRYAYAWPIKYIANPKNK